MEYRLLGRSGLKVSVLTLGTMTFGGAGFFAKTGSSDVNEARRLIGRATARIPPSNESFMLIVMKFGGTTVGSAERIASAAQLG